MHGNLEKAHLLLLPSHPKEIDPTAKSTDRKQKALLPKLSGGHCKGITQHNTWQDLFSESSQISLPQSSTLLQQLPKLSLFSLFFPNSWPPKLCQLPSLLSAAALPEWGWNEISPGLSSLLLRSIRLPLPSLQRFLRTKPGEEEKQCIFTCEYFCPVACLKKKKKLEGKTPEC